MNFNFIATYVELQDVPSYSTTISVEGQLLKLSFLWNERIGKRVLSIKNTSDVVYLQNTILHPNEPLELNSNAVLNDLPYSVTLVKTGDQKRVGNIFNWSKDFILCFSRTVDVEVEKLNVVYGVTKPSTPILPPSNGGGDNGGGNGGDNGGGGDIPSNEMHFTTTTGIIEYYGVIGDQLVFSNGTTITMDEDYLLDIAVPAGRHKVVLKESRRGGYAVLGGEALIELHNFPTLSSVSTFLTRFVNPSSNLVKVPTTLPSNITNIQNMFAGAISFNQDISSWDVSNVSRMSGMFQFATTFNQDLSSWNVSNVNDVKAMFMNATAFNQDLSGWCVSNITDPPAYFDFDATSWTLPRPVWGTCPT